jgi:ankyrin repeat protein
MLTRTFAHREIWPPELQCHSEEVLALHGAPLAHATLLHKATDYEELEIAEWLIAHGMDVNVRADVDGSGFGGHTPLFSCVVTYNSGRRDPALVHLLLEHGANPNARASIRKSLPFARDTSTHEYRDVTPLGWRRRFHDQSYVCQTSMRAMAEAGGRE